MISESNVKHEHSAPMLNWSADPAGQVVGPVVIKGTDEEDMD